MKNLLDIQTNIEFHKRPIYIPGDFRPLWRIAIIILFLNNASFGKKSSINRLHLFNWSIQNKENRIMLESILDGVKKFDGIFIRFDPSLLQAISFAQEEHLIELTKGNRVKLTQNGENLAILINQDTTSFIEEKKLINFLSSKKITEEMIKNNFWEGV